MQPKVTSEIPPGYTRQNEFDLFGAFAVTTPHRAPLHILPLRIIRRSLNSEIRRCSVDSGRALEDEHEATL